MGFNVLGQVFQKSVHGEGTALVTEDLEELQRIHEPALNLCVWQRTVAPQLVEFIDRVVSPLSINRVVTLAASDLDLELLLADVPGIKQAKPAAAGVQYNYAYFPIEVDEKDFRMSRDQLYFRLREWNVFARRYFYPIVPDFGCYRGMTGRLELPVARSVSSRIITLPIYSGLALEDVERICGIIGHLHREASAHRIVGTTSLPGNATGAAARGPES